MKEYTFTNKQNNFKLKVKAENPTIAKQVLKGVSEQSKMDEKLWKLKI